MEEQKLTDEQATPQPNPDDKKTRRKFKVPHVYVIIMVIALVAMVMTWVIPAGQYDRVENEDGRMVVDPGSFTFVDANPQNPFGVFRAFHAGIVETASIIAFIFVVGGAFAVVQDTGAIEAALGKITRKLKGREKIIIPIVMVAFSFLGATYGMAEETLPFIPIMIALCLSLGLDSMTGAGIVLGGAGVGFASAFINPFTVGVAQGIAGLPPTSGMAFRIPMYIVMTTATVIWMCRYAGKVRKDPTSSLMYEYDKTREDKLDLDNIPAFTARHIIILLLVLVTVITFIFGVIKLGWYLEEMSAIFLIMAVVCALVGKMGLNGFAESLVKGMSGIVSGALIVGFARAILIVLTNGAVMDTILFGAASLMSGLPRTFAAIFMYIFQCLLNFLIPSGSGQAAVSMPIMAPLGDLLGITRQTAVVAYQLGDGISNILTPTSGYFMAGLALAKIPWVKWARTFIPLFLLQYAVGAVFVVIATLINLGPF